MLGCLLVLTLLLTGCTSRDARQRAADRARSYLGRVERLSSAFAQADATFARRTAGNPGLPETALAGPGLVRAAGVYADGVAALTPPIAAAQAPQAELVADVRTFAADVSRLVAAARAGDQQGALAAGTAANGVAPSISSANRAISAAFVSRR